MNLLLSLSSGAPLTFAAMVALGADVLTGLLLGGFVLVALVFRAGRRAHARGHSGGVGLPYSGRRGPAAHDAPRLPVPPRGPRHAG